MTTAFDETVNKFVKANIGLARGTFEPWMKDCEMMLWEVLKKKKDLEGLRRNKLSTNI